MSSAKDDDDCTVTEEEDEEDDVDPDLENVRTFEGFFRWWTESYQNPSRMEDAMIWADSIMASNFAVLRDIAESTTMQSLIKVDASRASQDMLELAQISEYMSCILYARLRAEGIIPGHQSPMVTRFGMLVDTYQAGLRKRGRPQPPSVVKQPESVPSASPLEPKLTTYGMPYFVPPPYKSVQPSAPEIPTRIDNGATD